MEIAGKCVEEECQATAIRIINKNRKMSPYLSVFVDDCIERGLDLSQGGAVYNNYGAHGVGIASAADAIAAVKKAVFDDKRCSAKELVAAIKADFKGYDALRNYLLSCIQSFTKYDLTKIINGGPLTMEMHDNTFRNEDGVKKVAALVKIFIELGGHQLQLNSINREVLLDAQKHPEDHKNLIVRVWGWSGYFNELDVNYQNHIISRTEFTV